MNHWEHWEYVQEDIYTAFRDAGHIIKPSVVLQPNTAVYIQCEGYKRLEGIYDSKKKGIRRLRGKKTVNRDMRLYMDALESNEITIIAVDGLMGTGKTSTCISHLCATVLSGAQEDPEKNKDRHRILISKPHVLSGGEEYGFLPGDIDQKMIPTLPNYIQYFDRYHPLGFYKLLNSKLVDVLPLGFVRGLDADNMTIIVDEAQNSKELVSIVTRKAQNSRIIILGDTSPFQIDTPTNTTKLNGLTSISKLLKGAPYFQHIELKTVEHILRSPEVVDIVKRLFKSYGSDIEKWGQSEKGELE